MIKFSPSLPAYADPSFATALKNEIEQLDAKLLPLQQGLTAGGYALYDTFNVMIISSSEKEGRLLVKAGIFYRGVISACSCADDPSPVDETSEYCEVVFEIDRVTGEGTITLV